MGNWERLVWNQRDVLLAGLGQNLLELRSRLLQAPALELHIT